MKEIAQKLNIDYIEIPCKNSMQMNTQDSAGRVKKPVLELGLLYNDESDNEWDGNTQYVTDITSVKYDPAAEVNEVGEYDSDFLINTEML
ncbi:MAG: hypothetical protein AAFO15_00360 [Pseudomonadota bacterium]